MDPDPLWKPTSQGDSHPKFAANPTHAANRVKCCAVCWVFTAKFALNDSLKAEIQWLFDVQIDFWIQGFHLGCVLPAGLGSIFTKALMSIQKI